MKLIKSSQKSRWINNDTLFEREKSEIDAIMNFDSSNNSYTVLKGSVLSPNIAYSEKFRGAKSIEKARMNVVVNNVLQTDMIFKSASTAANFVTGNSTNGLTAWKNKDGVILKTLISGKEDGEDE